MNKGTQRLVNFVVATAIWGGLLYLVASHKIRNPIDVMKDIAVQGAKLAPPPPPPPKPKDLPPPPPPPKDLPPPPPPAPVASTVVAPAPMVAAPPAPACTASGPRVKRGFDTDRAYPERAQNLGIEGDVTVRYTVDASGSVASVEVISANPPGYFESAVQQEFRRMKWAPAQDDQCQPTTSSPQTQKVRFQLG